MNLYKTYVSNNRDFDHFIPRHWAYCMDQHRSDWEAMVGDVDKIFFFCVFLGKGYTLPKSKNSQSKMVDGFFSEAMLVSGRVLHFKSATLGKLFGKVDVNISIAKRYTQKFRKKELAQNFSDLFGTNRGRNPASVEVGSEYPSLYDGVMASFFLVEFWAESTVCGGSCGGLFEWSRSHSTSTIWPWGFSWIFS